MVARPGRPARCFTRRYAGAGRRDDGYNIVILVVMITVLNILIAKALPLWSAVIKREKEAELIFRGMQYAEAIRIYEMRTGSLPVKLEQLIEIEPRCIRQLWKNPMDEDGAWELIPGGRGRQVQGRNPNQNPLQNQNQNQRRGQNPLPGDPSRPDPSLRWVPGSEEKRIGSFPIFGVKSPGGGDAIKSFVTNPGAPDGGASNDLGEWLFTVDLAKALVVPYDGTAPSVPSMNIEQRFKPWPPNVKPIYVPSAKGGGKSALERAGQRNQPGGNRGAGNRGTGNRGSGNRGSGNRGGG